MEKWAVYTQQFVLDKKKNAASPRKENVLLTGYFGRMYDENTFWFKWKTMSVIYIRNNVRTSHKSCDM